MKNEGIVAIMIITMLILWVQHWGIASIVRKRFHPLVNYALGTLAIFVPLAVLFYLWGSSDELRAMLVVIFGAGAAVVGAYAVDHYADRIHALIADRRAGQEAAERERAALVGLRKATGVDHAQK